MNVCTGLPVHLFVREAREGRPQTIERVVRGIEELGFFGVTAPDHILHIGAGHAGHEDEVMPNWRYADPVALLTFVAAFSRTVRLIPRVTVIPYRQPFATAHALATLDSLSGGRLVFAPGVGSDRTEFEVMGVPRRERGKITDEYLEIIFKLWALERVTHQGRYFRFEGAGLLVRPVQQPRPPVWVGGSSAASLHRALRIGDGWTPSCFPYPSSDPQTRGCVSVQQLREDAAWANRERAAAGKARLEIAASSGPPLKILPRPQRGRRSRESIDYFSCVGTPDELAEEYQAFKNAGATSFVVNFFANTAQEYLQAAGVFRREIMPALA